LESNTCSSERPYTVDPCRPHWMEMLREAAFLQAFTGLGLGVLVPFGGGQPYDLVADLSTGLFLRVQCKAARLRDGCLIFNSRTTDHGRGRLSYLGLADVLGAHYAPSRAVYLLPVQEATSF